MNDQTAETATRRLRPGSTLAGQVSALEPQPVAGTSINLEYGKRLMLFSGRANPALAAKIAGKLNVDLGGVTLKTFSNGEVYCRYEESIRGADVFIVQPTCANPQEGVNANDALMELMVMIDAAIGASAHRVIAVTPWYGYSRQDKKSAAARADHRPPRRPHARGRGRRPRAHDGPARRPDAGLLPEAGRPHDGDVHPHAVLPRPAARRHRRRLARRRPREAGQEVRREGRRRAGDPQQGAPRPAGRRDRLRDRRRQGQDRRDRRRPDRHRRHAARRGRDRQGRGRALASTPAPRTACSPATRGRTSPPRRSRRSSSPTRSRCAPARPPTSACSPAPTC